MLQAFGSSSFDVYPSGRRTAPDPRVSVRARNYLTGTVDVLKVDLHEHGKNAKCSENAVGTNRMPCSGVLITANLARLRSDGYIGCVYIG